MQFNPAIFKAYDVRGVYPDELGPEVANRIGLAFARYLLEDRKLTLPLSVVVGLDMRGSSPFLAREVIRGLNEEGVDVVDIGRVPTPAFYYAIAFHDYAAGVMITASHNPKQYNGFKFCGSKAAPIGAGSGMEKIREYAAVAEPPAKVLRRGGFQTLPDMTAAYVSQDLSYLNAGKIKPLKIVADPANAMGSLYLEEMFRRLGSDAIKLNWELNGNMPIHEANPLKLETLQQLQEVIKHEHADLGIATDGDGDRIVFLDETAVVVPAAIILGLVAQALLARHPGARIGYDLRMSRVAAEMIRAAGGEPVETMVGHSLIKKLMAEKDVLFSGEVSSHYYFRENYNYESPVFVAAQLLALRSQTDEPFSQIWEAHQKYAQSGELNFQVVDKQAVLDRLEKQYADGQVSKLDGVKVQYPEWWFNARVSNTEPVLRLNVEADTPELLEKKVTELKARIGA